MTPHFASSIFKAFPLAILAALAAASCLAAGPEAEWFVDFEDGSRAGWHLPLPEHWEIVERNGNRALRLTQGGPVGEPRRPVKFAMWTEGCVSSFELEVRLLPEAEDMIVVFGYQDRLHFYYAHLSAEDSGAHPVHNGLFLVNGGERVRIDRNEAPPALRGEGWRHVRVVRDAVSGKIEVFINGEARPRFHHTNKTLGFGLTGAGSFDNTGAFDDFRLRGTRSGRCELNRISPLDSHEPGASRSRYERTKTESQ